MAKRFEPPKGTRDFLPHEMRKRALVFDRLRHYFSLYGFDQLDTPAFESLEVLTLKSGPGAENEIYSFRDKSDRLLGLRFDLTSSTGRVAANHPELPRPLYRYQIGKVWRYDRPQAGRYREFYQADADIIGSSSLFCEVELLRMAVDILESFGLRDYRFAINNRKLLDAQLRASQIAAEKKPDALRALDKLHKIGKDGVATEFQKYGLTPEEFARFFDILVVDSPEQAKSKIGDDQAGHEGVLELETIFASARELGFADKLEFDWSLVRGLDYYTGPIFEAQSRGASGGSFGGGGRYDDLVGLYGGPPQGAVGFSFGVERLISLMDETTATPKFAGITVAAVEETALSGAQKLSQNLRAAGVAVRFLGVSKRDKVFKYTTAIDCTKVILVGAEELASGRYGLRDTETRQEQKLTSDELINVLRQS